MIYNKNLIKIKNGLLYYPHYLNAGQIAVILSDIKNIIVKSPFFQPVMPKTAKPLSVKMTNVGTVGWVSDKSGYRYQKIHPVTQESWLPIPDSLLTLWHTLITGYEPDCCLINLYHADAYMGLHCDKDEKDLTASVLSISLGAAALFRHGGTERNHPTSSFKIYDGDVIILSNESRLIYHAIDKIFIDDKHQKRINITMRKAL